MKVTSFKYLFGLLIVSLFSCESNTVEETPVETEDTPKEIKIEIPDGFILDDLHTPSESNRGSWVSLAEGPDSMLYASDQYGHIYTFPMPGANTTIDTNKIEKLPFPLGQANSMLWAFNSLYVVVNGWMNEDYLGSGLYRLTDSDGDGSLDKLNMLLDLDGSGEHGPHSLVLSPDGNTLFLLAGNHTKIPKAIEKSRLPMNWGEDNLLTPYKDARGHASEIEAPGGWIAMLDSTAQNIELFSAGYRNPFDLAFNKAGELFTFDADMEWDMGMPWYRPVRVCHVTSGSEYGWRTGSGKWPVYYPDNLSPVINLGQGSPTGIFMGNGLKFPSRYQDGLFVMDWSFGTIYYVDLEESGSTYTGTSEEFLAGTPLPLTDAIVGSDGHLYFATGGRRLESHLYRLRYVGNESTNARENDNKINDLIALRRQLENFHKDVKSAQPINLAWNNLDHSDRFIRYAARVALEHQNPKYWVNKVLGSKESSKIIQGAIAIARTDQSNFLNQALQQLNTIDFKGINSNLQLDLLRAYSLLMIRLGKPSGTILNQTLTRLNPLFPADNDAINRELGRLLIYLEAPDITEKTVALLDKLTAERNTSKDGYLSDEVTDRSEKYGPDIKAMLENMPPSEAIYHAMSLSYADHGWNKALLDRYFDWFYTVFNSKGGMSFKGFMDKVRFKALEKVPEADKDYYLEKSGIFSPTAALGDLPQPQGPGKAYTNKEVNEIVFSGLNNYEGSVEDGELIYQAALCAACHRVRGEGGNSGPDLTQVSTRFNTWEMIYAIYTPNEAISDQYAFNLYTLKDGSKITGRMIEDNATSTTIQPNPYDETLTITLSKSDIQKTELSPISPMPPRLLDRLNEEEIVDLFAYLVSGGDPEHEVYMGKEGE